ncbi:MAG: RNA-directed DNA polymerase, partial [Proteobacteria bacterium]
MSESPKPDRRYRTLLSETLPFEVPVIFSNDRFFFSSSNQIRGRDVAHLLERLRPRSNYSLPYNYRISKGNDRYTTLSVIHPLNQLAVADFYEANSRAMIAACAKSPFSLRRPAEVASTLSPSRMNPADPQRHGIAHLEVDEDETDVSHYVTYYKYRRYNLINRFFDSPELTRMEKRFNHMRTLDISKCFQNIYTHSESWAVKDKPYAKRHTTHYSFEGEFDRLMQRMNYNETAGIVIGPEVSRIFAEIILQSADKEIYRRLRDECELQEGKHYSVRRYVDDYFLFGHNEKDIRTITRVISETLEFYKLYLNDEKQREFESPFVTPITLAR